MLNCFFKSKRSTRALKWNGCEILPNSKRSQVGITITWFVAFIIIFFILMIFVGIVATIAAQKGIGKNEISVVENGFNKVSGETNLITFLNSPVDFNGEKMNFKELIFRWDKDNGLKKEIEVKMEDYFKNKNCYALEIYNPTKNYGNLFVFKGQIQSENFVTPPSGVFIASSLVDDRWIKIMLNDGNKLVVNYLEC